MHPSISQRRAILEGLRERARLATAEFYQKPNTIAPALAPRFIVKPSGNNTFEVIERATGKFITERFGIKQLGKALRSWASAQRWPCSSSSVVISEARQRRSAPP